MKDFFLSLNWESELWFAGRVLFAALLGSLVGLEREYHQKEAGMRTQAVVCMGACLFAIISSHIPGAEPSRIASNIVVGIGFIGAGVILHQGDRAIGLTTAASVWVIAAVGMGVGFGMYILAAATALIVLGLLSVHHMFAPPQKDPEKK
ncbi:MAG TPA: MgtC/SapB family protein [Planctomycetota bacterium]|nr:MgtC/SapB family protein [Planctomycetota bacterium]